MKFEIYGEKNDSKVNRIALEGPDSDGDLNLIVVDQYGGRLTTLISLLKDGRYSLNTAVNSDLGFQLDSDGRLLRGRDS